VDVEKELQSTKNGNFFDFLKYWFLTESIINFIKIKVFTLSRACRICFSDSTALCNLKIATYSFPAFCCDLAKRVVRSIQTTRTPET